MQGSKIRRRCELHRLFHRSALIVAIALASVVAVAINPANASATIYQTASGGACQYGPSGNVSIYTGAAEFDSAGPTTRVDEWVRLVDLAGNRQTDWYYAGAKYASPGSPALFGQTYIPRAAWNTRSRIQAYFEASVNGAFRGDVYSTTTSYALWSNLFFNGLGYVNVNEGTDSSCYW
jgi:hypothetical protein